MRERRVMLGGEDRRLRARLAVAALVAAALAVPFTLLLVLVVSAWAPLGALDRGTATRLHLVALAHPTLVRVLDVAATVLHPWVFRAVAAVVAGWLAGRGAFRMAWWLVTTVAAGGLIGAGLKLVVARARPHLPDPVAVVSGYSFPSGHALNSFLVTGALLLLALPRLAPRRRAFAAALAALVVLAVGFDRVALGVHYVSDVLAGWLVALGCLAATSAAFETWRRSTVGQRAGPGTGGGVEPDASPPST